VLPAVEEAERAFKALEASHELLEEKQASKEVEERQAALQKIVDAEDKFEMAAKAKEEAFEKATKALESFEGMLAVQRAGLPTPDDYIVLPDQLSSEAIAIAYRRDDAAMKAVVDGVISEAAASGKAQEWYDKWFTKPIPLGSVNKSLDIPMSSELKAAFSKK
jgi:Mg-chelatase subunit ChlI